MKHASLTAIALLTLAATTIGAAAQGVSMALRAGGVVPKVDDEWDTGASFDLGFVFWASPNVGLWLGGGAQDWPVAEESVALDDGGWFATDGRASVVPFGASILLWGELADNLAIQLEGGLRYAAVDSDVTVETWLPEYMTAFEFPIEIDDTVLAVASLQVEYATEFWSLGLGGGYQWDLGKPDQEFLGQTLSEADFSAALFFVSFALSF